MPRTKAKSATRAKAEVDQSLLLAIADEINTLSALLRCMSINVSKLLAELRRMTMPELQERYLEIHGEPTPHATLYAGMTREIAKKGGPIGQAQTAPRCANHDAPSKGAKDQPKNSAFRLSCLESQLCERMFAYVDESGNTGSNVFDPNQPIFMTGAMMVRDDFDHHHGHQIAQIAASIQVQELHGSELGVGGIVKIADAVADVLRSAGAEFYFCRVVKLHLAAGKFFDTFFDSGENVAVPWLCYNTRPLRLMLMLKTACLLDEDLLRLFWNSLLEIDKAKCMAGFVECLTSFRPRINDLPDARSRKVLGEATDWAIANPEVIQGNSCSREASYGHLPNMAAFPLLLAGIEHQSKSWGAAVHTITHDEQKQFATGLATWHKMFANAAPTPVYAPLGEQHVMLRVPGSKFAIKSSKTSAGLQVLDICLWCMKRMLDGLRFPCECDNLMYRLLSRGGFDDFSFANAEAAVRRFLEASSDPSGDQIDEARAFVELGEQSRRENMAAYRKTKDDAALSTTA